MPRAEVGTPKYLANKMKAKGLQKLRWYCQMCQKQCRDENGFKCHTMSESHQRQLLLFADNSKRYIDDFSFDFAKGYVSILKRQFGSKRVNANRVYQEYISDRDHVHMNGTRWVTLTGFVKWLGKTGQCIVDETEKGKWFITYIDRSPETVEKEEKKKKKLKMDKNDEEKTLEFVERQIKAALEKSGPPPEKVFTEFVRENEEEPIKLDLQIKSKKLLSNNSKQVFKRPAAETATGSSVKKIKSEFNLKTALDEIKEMEESKREKQNRKDYWITEGIVVKIVTKSLGEAFYKQKGYVREVIDKYGAIVKLLEGGKKVKIDQLQLETVIPAIGKLVKVVNGAYRGEIAKLLKLVERNCCVSIEIEKGPLKGRRVDNVPYEDISKLHED